MSEFNHSLREFLFSYMEQKASSSARIFTLLSNREDFFSAEDIELFLPLFKKICSYVGYTDILDQIELYETSQHPDLAYNAIWNLMNQ